MRFFLSLTKFWIILLLGAAAAYFLLFNLKPLFLTIPWPYERSFEMRTATALLLAFLLGSAVTTLLLGLSYSRKHLEIRRLKKRLAVHHKSTPGSRTSVHAPEATTEPSFIAEHEARR